MVASATPRWKTTKHHRLISARSIFILFLSSPLLSSWHLVDARSAKHLSAMICPISHLWWYQLLADRGTLLSAVGTGRLEITNVQSTSSNWQLLPSDSVYYIRNEALGPLFQLGLSCDSHEPGLVSTSLLSTEQQWELRIDDGGGVRVQNVALGEMGILNISRTGPGCDPGDVWSIKPLKLIDDVSFLSSTQVYLFL